LPVTLTPTTVDTFSVNVFEGATIDGTPTGTAMGAGQKSRIVDAIWTINRSSINTNSCGITTGFVSGLEGSVFTSLANNQIGLSRYDGANWTVASGSGDNAANTATENTFTSFGAFGVGQIGLALPSKLYNFTAIQEQSKIKLIWNVDAEINVSNYVVEKSNNGITFNSLQVLNANNSRQYTTFDFAPSNINYYRIKIVDNNNTFSYSSVLKIKTANPKAEVSIYPNPVKGSLLNILLSNFEKGKTDIKVYNSIGQLITYLNFDFDGGSTIKSIALPAATIKGIYRIVVTNNYKDLVQNILVD
jgi:hypothetical protein